MLFICFLRAKRQKLNEPSDDDDDVVLVLDDDDDDDDAADAAAAVHTVPHLKYVTCDQIRDMVRRYRR